MSGEKHEPYFVHFRCFRFLQFITVGHYEVAFIRELSSQLHEFLFQNVHQGYPRETLVRFLKAREWHVTNAHKMVS
jgi:hypothetical protein